MEILQLPPPAVPNAVQFIEEMQKQIIQQMGIPRKFIFPDFFEYIKPKVDYKKLRYDEATPVLPRDIYGNDFKVNGDLLKVQKEKPYYRRRTIYNTKQFEEKILRLGYTIRRVAKLRGEKPIHNEVLFRRGVVDVPARNGIGLHRIYRKSSIKFIDLTGQVQILKGKRGRQGIYAHGNGIRSCYGTFDELFEQLTEYGEYGRVIQCSQSKSGKIPTLPQ